MGESGDPQVPDGEFRDSQEPDGEFRGTQVPDGEFRRTGLLLGLQRTVLERRSVLFSHGNSGSLVSSCKGTNPMRRTLH